MVCKYYTIFVPNVCTETLKNIFGTYVHSSCSRDIELDIDILLVLL